MDHKVDKYLNRALDHKVDQYPNPFSTEKQYIKYKKSSEQKINNIPFHNKAVVNMLHIVG